MTSMAPELDFAAVFPDEVVTHAHVREVELPHAAGTMALITLDNGLDHTRPNSFGPQGLAELDAALDSVLDRDDIAAVAITGKPFILAAGADITGMPRITEPRAGAGDRPLRPSRVRQARRRAEAVVRLHQRSRHRRRARGRPQLHLPHGDRIRAGGRVQRMLPGHRAGLGR